MEEFSGQTYGTEVRKSINEMESKVTNFVKTEDLTTDQQLYFMHIERYKLKS